MRFIRNGRSLLPKCLVPILPQLPSPQAWVLFLLAGPRASHSATVQGPRASQSATLQGPRATLLQPRPSPLQGPGASLPLLQPFLQLGPASPEQAMLKALGPLQVLPTG